MAEPARAGADDRQRETDSINVNLNEADRGKAVTRMAANNEPIPSGDESDDALTRAMQKRIARMNRSFDQRLADQQAAHQRELASLRNQFDRLSINRGGDAPAGDDAAHEQAMAALQAKLEDAQERGDSKAVAALTREISAKDAQFWASKTNAVMGREESPKGGQAAPVRPGVIDPVTGQPPVARPGPVAMGWMEENDMWWEDPDYVAEKAAANAIHHQLVAEGSDADSPDHFVRLTRRLQKKFPTLAVKLPVGAKNGKLEDSIELDPDRKAPAPRSPNAAGGDAPVGGGHSDVRLTGDDLKTMRSMGWDPNNNQHVLQFARSKRETEAAYAAQRDR